MEETMDIRNRFLMGFRGVKYTKEGPPKKPLRLEIMVISKIIIPMVPTPTGPIFLELSTTITKLMIAAISLVIVVEAIFLIID